MDPSSRTWAWPPSVLILRVLWYPVWDWTCCRLIGTRNGRLVELAVLIRSRCFAQAHNTFLRQGVLWLPWSFMADQKTFCWFQFAIQTLYSSYSYRCDHWSVITKHLSRTLTGYDQCEKLPGGWTFRRSETEQNCDVNCMHTVDSWSPVQGCT